jgi:hypothetical protein
VGSRSLKTTKDMAKEFDKTDERLFLHFAASQAPLHFQDWAVNITVDIMKDPKFNGNLGLDVYVILNQ